MKTYAHYGFNDFVLLLGYKGDQIKRYLSEYEDMSRDFTLNTKTRKKEYYSDVEDWDVTFADTGILSLTEKRLDRARRYLEGGPFMLTYGDGVADIDLKKLQETHEKSGKTGTITVFNPESKYGLVNVDDNGNVLSFKEKPRMQELVNVGFMAFKPDLFDMISDDNVMIEKSMLPKLAGKGQLGYYHHQGFWKPMDTYKDYSELNNLWARGERKWQVWK